MNSLPPVLFAFADLVLAHPEWEVSVLCQTLGVSTKTLARICGRILGLTPKQWLLSYRMRCWRVALQDQTDVLASALEHFGALSSAYRHAAHALGMSPASIRRGGAGAWLVFGSCQTPWGNLTVAQSDKGISWVCVQGNPESFAQELFDTYPKAQLIRMDHKFAHWADALQQRWPMLVHANALPETMLLALLQHHLLQCVLNAPLPMQAFAFSVPKSPVPKSPLAKAHHVRHQSPAIH